MSQDESGDLLGPIRHVGCAGDNRRVQAVSHDSSGDSWLGSAMQAVLGIRGSPREA